MWGFERKLLLKHDISIYMVSMLIVWVDEGHCRSYKKIDGSSEVLYVDSVPACRTAHSMR